MDFCLSNTDLQWAELSSYWERSCSPCLWSKVKSTVLVWMHVHPAYRSPLTQHHLGSASCYSIFGSCMLAVMGRCPCVLLSQSQVSEGTHSIMPVLTVCPVKQCMFPLVRDYTQWLLLQCGTNESNTSHYAIYPTKVPAMLFLVQDNCTDSDLFRPNMGTSIGE